MTCVIRNGSRRLSIAALMMTTSLGAGTAFAATAPADNQTTVQEVVVTAQKRSENVQQVPVAVTALRGQNLRNLGLENLTDYAQYVPGLVVTPAGSPGQTTVILRGVAPLGPGATVGYYIDDTPMGSSGAYSVATDFGLDLLPYDLQDLQVLRGPQGTLYGASSMGGVIKYGLVQADPSKFGAQAGGEIDDINHSNQLGYGVRAAVNIPIVDDKLAIRVSGFDQKDQGYVDNVRLGVNDVNGADQYGGRVALTWQAAPNLKVNLNAIWYRLDSDDQSTVTLGDLSEHTLPGGAIQVSGSPTLGDYDQSQAFRQPFNKNIDFYSGTINWDVGPFSVVSSTGWSQTRTDRFYDETGSVFSAYPTILSGGALPQGVASLNYALNLDKFSQEVRLVSPTGGAVEWLAGAFYTKETNSLNELVNVYQANYQPITGPTAPLFNPYLELVNLPSTFQEYAAFGDLTVHLGQQFDITAGLRASHNDQTFAEIAHGQILPGGVLDEPGTSSDSEVTWQVNGRYHIDKNVMAYVRVATGYQPGGPNPTVSGTPQPNLQPATLINYEGGVKSTFWDGRAVLDVAVFDIEWDKIQLNVMDPTTQTTIFGNGGHAYSRGVEVEGTVTPIKGLQIGYDAAYTKAQLTSNAANASPPFILGYQLEGVPQWTAGLTAIYSWTLPNDWRANVGGGLHYIDKEWTSTPESGQFITQNPSYTTVDLHAGVTVDRYTINLFARNLLDKRVYLQEAAVTNPFTGTNFLNSIPLQPRTIGLSIDGKF